MLIRHSSVNGIVAPVPLKSALNLRNSSTGFQPASKQVSRRYSSVAQNKKMPVLLFYNES